MKIENQLTNFILSLITEKNMSLNTASSYKTDLKIFFKFLNQSKLKYDQTSAIHIEAFLANQKQKEFSDSTIARRLSSIKQFYKFLVKENKIKENPCAKIVGFKKAQKIPWFLSEKEVLKMLESAIFVGRTTLEKVRNKALLEILYGSGMRVSELVSLKKAIFIGNPDIILIKGKGNKERMVPISKEAQIAIKKYLNIMKKTNKTFFKSEYLFPSKSKKGFLNREKFFLIIKEIAVFSGLNAKKVSPHKVRHAFASHLLSNGADLRVIQTLLGHKNLSTTEIYTHILDEKIIKTVRDKHPFAKKDLSNL
ncbi:tyrosine recombinase [Paracoccaceae bacterium]|nr:tyrosine recombinase [Paracoccaceae bacterium]